MKNKEIKFLTTVAIASAIAIFLLNVEDFNYLGIFILVAIIVLVFFKALTARR